MARGRVIGVAPASPTKMRGGYSRKLSGEVRPHPPSTGAHSSSLQAPTADDYSDGGRFRLRLKAS